MGFLIRDLIAEGSDEGLEALFANRSRVIDAATQIIFREREAKETASSTDEWLFEAYCLLPEILAWLWVLREMRNRAEDDELSKYDRVLDEFQADISTTITIPILHRNGSWAGLGKTYALDVLDRADSIDAARHEIRGIFKGRSIVPRVWYDEAMAALDRIERGGLPAHSDSFTRAEVEKLDRTDMALLFGCALTKDGKRDHWWITDELFGFSDTDETPQSELGSITFSL